MAFTADMVHYWNIQLFCFAFKFKLLESKFVSMKNCINTLVWKVESIILSIFLQSQ